MSSTGDGIDVVAPAVGVIIHYQGGITLEKDGTSYASPIVVGTLACMLSKDTSYFTMKATARTDFAAQTLLARCVDLGLETKRQGKGLPSIGRRMLGTIVD